LMFIIHQLQGAFAIGAMLIFATFAGKVTVGRRLIIIVAILSGIVLSKAWWYFDPIEYVLLGEVQKGRLYADWRDPMSMLILSGFACFGILGFYDLNRKRLRLDLLVGTSAIAIGFAIMWQFNIWVYFRILPFLILFLQLGFTCLVLDLLPSLSESSLAKLSAKQVRLLCFMAILAFGLSVNIYRAEQFRFAINTNLKGVEATYPDTWSPHIMKAMAEIRRIFEPGSVLLAHAETAFPVEASHLKVVAIPRLFALVPDMLERQLANREFFEENTSVARRCEIVEKYG